MVSNGHCNAVYMIIYLFSIVANFVHSGSMAQFLIRSGWDEATEALTELSE